jgi:hypothetical protein
MLTLDEPLLLLFPSARLGGKPAAIGGRLITHIDPRVMA